MREITTPKLQAQALDLAERTDMEVRVSPYVPRDAVIRIDEAAMPSLHAGGAPMYSLVIHPLLLAELNAGPDPIDRLAAVLEVLTIAAIERLDRLARNL